MHLDLSILVVPSVCNSSDQRFKTMPILSYDLNKMHDCGSALTMKKVVEMVRNK
jgi:hypothetical protein